ncbi:lasso peptide biosynthesis B2 protein [Phenylobacterium sp.]|uniref:lasso peptide biosynthesis B2 protein n=1 Tax=Phenylobacterium sp. TaxID=1871053 RepID=UPI002B6293E6|nr:lasso peptide biosynthesis B2 protein [Phenylobacterium sp.]HVI33756.1 lasso peptide biosynthesis B2 protein [Phenylobacterium sp.]
MEHPLSPAAHAVAIGDDLVFLQVMRDAYLCVPGAPGRLSLSRDGGAVALEDPALLASLLAAGLVGGAGPRLGVTPPPPPAQSAVTGEGPAPGWPDATRLLRAMVDAGLGYGGRPLAALVRGVRPAGVPPPSGAPSPELLAEAARFHAWIPYAPLPGKCLLRSFLLLRALRRRGHDAAWVFAVRTWPFRAHCWLQAGDVVLDDHHERLVAYHPIMAV